MVIVDIMFCPCVYELFPYPHLSSHCPLKVRTKWRSIFRHFLLHFIKRHLMYFDANFTECFPRNPLSIIRIYEIALKMVITIKNKFHPSKCILNIFCKLVAVLFWPHTHWGRDKMDAISQTTFSSTFSWMKMFEFRLKFHWSFFLRVE